MLDHKQLKTQAFRFGRSLQMLFRTVGMFSADHPAASAPLQMSFDLLNALVKETGEFTLGFVDQRIMVNNILTDERTLKRLEDEFLRRGIGAITFHPGMTLAAYKRGLAVLARPVKAIDAAGGLAKHLQQDPLEFMSVLPALKSQMRTEGGDTVLDTDAQSYLLAKVLRDEEAPGNVGVLPSFDSILRSVGADGAGGGKVAAAESVTGIAEGAGPGSAGSGAGMAGGSRPGGAPSGPAAAGLGPYDSAEATLQATLLDPAGAPQRSFREMARAIQELQPEFVLSAFPAERRDELRALPPDQMAAEIIEDTAVKWAAQHLGTVPSSPEACGVEQVEEEVMRVLARILQTTKTSERLAIKLARCFKDIAAPPAIAGRIQEELEWSMTSQEQKLETLLSLKHFDRRQFRRLLELLRESIKGADQKNATRLANHYLRLLEPESEALPEEISRIPELFAAMASVRSDFWPKSAELLTAALRRTGNGTQPAPAAQLLEGKDSEHGKILQFIVALAKNAALYEEFDLIQGVGAAVEELAAKAPEKHQACCGAALPTLLLPTAVERILEIYRQQRDDLAWTRKAATLLRWSGPAAIAQAFQQLVDEPVAFNRFALMRLIARIGPSAIDLARQRLAHERWYVVRNTCKLLAELKDPDLLAQLTPLLRHPDERVQRAAAVVLMESRSPARSLILAEALPYLRPHVLKEVLQDLFSLRDPAIVPALERFIFSDAQGKNSLLMTAVQVLAVIPGERVEHLLGKILADSSLGLQVRRIAMLALVHSSTATSAQAMREFISGSPGDPLAQECKP